MIKSPLFQAMFLTAFLLTVNIFLDMLWSDFRAEWTYFSTVLSKTVLVSLGMLLYFRLKTKWSDGRMF
jgi:hypothetical protein